MLFKGEVPQKPLAAAGNDPTKVTCFCDFCKAEAKRRGIDVKRAIDGFHELEKWVNLCRSGAKIPDGHYVTFWRVIFQYPEVLAWGAKGKSASQISQALRISKRTVDEHTQTAARKLGAANRTQAVVIALRNRIIEA